MTTDDRTTDDEQAVLDAEDRRYRALVEGDLDTLEQVFADELSYTHSSGAVDTKASYMEKLRSGYYVYKSAEHPVDRVSVVGDCAIVVGRMIADIEVQGTPKHLDNLALVVWTRASGSWQVLAFAPTVPPAR